MLNFSNIKKIPEIKAFFLPASICGHVVQNLKQAGYSFTVYKFRDTQKLFKPEAEKEINQRKNRAVEKYNKAGCVCDAPGMCCIFSDLDPDELFIRTTQLFGPTIDPDYKKETEKWQKMSQKMDEV